MRLRRRHVALAVALVLALAGWLRSRGPQVPPAPVPPTPMALERGGASRVARVLDGDTVKLADGRTVRLIGVDAPETHHPELPVQRFGEEAGEFLRGLVEGSEVSLEVNPAEPKDRYGRTLAYLWKGDLLVNREVIRRGYAYAYSRFAHPRLAEFVAVEREARQAQYGLWHLSIRDGRLANLAMRYDRLSLEGRRRLDEDLERLLRECPAEKAEPSPPPSPEQEHSGAASWRDAGAWIGRRGTFEGVVVASRTTEKSCLLNFHKDYTKHLTALIFASAYARFPSAPEKLYRGRRVRVTGLVKEYKGRPEIVVEDPSQIEVVE